MGARILLFKRRNPGFQRFFCALLNMEARECLIKKIEIEHRSRSLEISMGNPQHPSCFALTIRRHRDLSHCDKPQSPHAGCTDVAPEPLRRNREASRSGFCDERAFGTDRPFPQTANGGPTIHPAPSPKDQGRNRAVLMNVLQADIAQRAVGVGPRGEEFGPHRMPAGLGQGQGGLVKDDVQGRCGKAMKLGKLLLWK